jgi:hypothetical protein
MAVGYVRVFGKLNSIAGGLAMWAHVRMNKGIPFGRKHEEDGSVQTMILSTKFGLVPPN